MFKWQTYLTLFLLTSLALIFVGVSQLVTCLRPQPREIVLKQKKGVTLND